MASNSNGRHAEENVKQTTFTLDRRRQLQDIIIFETRLREEYRILQQEKQKCLLIFGALLLCNLVTWINLFWPAQKDLLHHDNINRLAVAWSQRDGVSSLIPVVLSLSCVGCFFFSDTYKAKIGSANWFVPRCNLALQHCHVYFCPKSGKLYPLATKQPSKVADEKLTWWQKGK